MENEDEFLAQLEEDLKDIEDDALFYVQFFNNEGIKGGMYFNKRSYREFRMAYRASEQQVKKIWYDTTSREE